jgi:restriction system protein
VAGRLATVRAVAIPDFQTLLRPLLVAVEDGEEHSIKSVREQLAREFALTEEELADMLPSGRAKTYMNRVGWATTYLYRSGLLERPKRSVYRITDRGRSVLRENPERIDLKVLSQFPELREFQRGSAGTSDLPKLGTETTAEASLVLTPEERVDSAYRELRAALAAEVPGSGTSCARTGSLTRPLPPTCRTRRIALSASR